MAARKNRIHRYISRIWLPKRMEMFLRTFTPKQIATILDVGGQPWFWTSVPPLPSQIDTLNIFEVSFDQERFPDHKIRVLMGDGCNLSFADKSYDCLFSNSVIEHVGTWEKQQQFAIEARRVGKNLWIQTPAYECPFEPHFFAPFVHWLPLFLRRYIVRWLSPWVWLQRPKKEVIEDVLNTTRLLKYKEMKKLFPDCEIYVERMFRIIPKSYVAIRNN